MNNTQFTVGLGEEGRVSSKTTRIHPPGGLTHISTEIVPESAAIKNGSRVTRPPGGASSIAFDDAPDTPRARSTNYKMASNFELGDEQPTLGGSQQNRRRSKPSVNPLTGELVGTFTSPSAGGSPDLARKDSEANSLKSGSNESVNTVDSGSVASDNSSHREVLANATQQATPLRNRVPPGGYSSPLW